MKRFHKNDPRVSGNKDQVAAAQLTIHCYTHTTHITIGIVSRAGYPPPKKKPKAKNIALNKRMCDHDLP